MRNPRTRCGSLRIGLSDEHSAVGSCNSPTCRLYINVYNSIFELLFKILYRAVKQKLLSLFFLSLSLSLSIIVWSNLRKKEGNRERRKSNSSRSRLKKKKKIFEQFEKGDFHRHTVPFLCVTIRTFQAWLITLIEIHWSEIHGVLRGEREREKKFYFV